LTPQEEIELLLRVVARIAQSQLEKGGFIPFGATLEAGRDVQLLMPNSAKGEMTIEVVDAYWRKQMSKAIETGNVKALCTVADVRVTDADAKLVPGVFIHVEHAGGDSEDILYPYTKDADSKVTFLEVTRAVANLQFFSTLDEAPQL
jgi:hypothetical protein